MKVFGRVRAKDVALKYNRVLRIKRKNTVGLRAILAVKSGGSGGSSGFKEKAGKKTSSKKV